MNIKTKIGTVLLVILIALLFFSKTIYTYHLPVVTAGKPEIAILNKEAYTVGVVSFAESLDLYAPLSAKVEEVSAGKGDFVYPDQPILTLSVDTKGITQTLAQIAISRERIALELEGIQAQLAQIDRSKMDKDTAADSRNACMRQLQAKELDNQALDLQEAAAMDELAIINQSKALFAPESGVLTFIGCKAGQRVSEGQLIATIGVSGSYQIECSVSPDDTFISIGDTCFISNAAHKLQATVTNIELLDHVSRVTLTPENVPIRIGETFQIHFQKRGLTPATMVLNSALNKDTAGYFLYQIKRRDGLLGKEYYTEKLPVIIGDSDNEKTVILDGIHTSEPIVIISNRLFSENEVVKVKNESDFFEN